MSQIYLHGIFASAWKEDHFVKHFDGMFTAWKKNQSVTEFNELLDIPDCELIALVLWDTSQIELIISQLILKTKKLLIYFLEPGNPNFVSSLLSCIKKFPQEKITMFGNASLNFTVPNYQVVPNWFLEHTNIYSDTAWGQHLLSTLEYKLNRPKKFDCLLGGEKPHRDTIEKFYKNSKFCNDFIFTYFKDNLHNGIWPHPIKNQPGTADLVKIQKVKPNDMSHMRISHILPVEIYNQSYYSIVAETFPSNAHSHYTEKTAKPIIAKRPFIMFSGQYFLRNLRSLGFKTFGSVIDETYDTIENHDKRYEAAWAQVEWLCQQNPDDIIDELTDILEYNHQHFMSTNWHQPIFSCIDDLKINWYTVRESNPSY